MAGWLQAALKAVIPHVGDILSATKPAFTQRKSEAAANPPELVQQQIAELQSAVSQQAAHVKELAAQLENTVVALEKAAQVAEARLRRVLVFTAVAAAFAVAPVRAQTVLFEGARVIPGDGGAYERYTGDNAVPGKGEILVWRAK